jgi:hypothetical protein
MSFPITAPVYYEVGISGAPIDFNATGGTSNIIKNFVTTSRGDMIICLTGSSTNQLERLAIGTEGYFLRVVGGIPSWANFDSLTAVKTATQAKPATALPVASAIITGAWTLTTNAGGSQANDSFNPSGPFNTTSGIFTVPATGTYHIIAEIQAIQSVNGGQGRRIAIVQSPSPGPGTIVASNIYTPASSTTIANTYSVSSTLNFNSGDTFAIELASATVATLTVQLGSRLSVIRLR